MFCPMCGKKNRDSSNFCARCGASLKRLGVPASRADAAPERGGSVEAPAEQAFANVVPEVDSVPSKEVGEVAERQQEILVDAAPGGNDTPFEEVAEVAESQQEVIADATPEGGGSVEVPAGQAFANVAPEGDDIPAKPEQATPEPNHITMAEETGPSLPFEAISEHTEDAFAAVADEANDMDTLAPKGTAGDPSPADNGVGRMFASVDVGTFVSPRPVNNDVGKGNESVIEAYPTFAQGLPDWDLTPPSSMVIRHVRMAQK